MRRYVFDVVTDSGLKAVAIFAKNYQMAKKELIETAGTIEGFIRILSYYTVESGFSRQIRADYTFTSR